MAPVGLFGKHNTTARTRLRVPPVDRSHRERWLTCQVVVHVVCVLILILKVNDCQNCSWYRSRWAHRIDERKRVLRHPSAQSPWPPKSAWVQRCHQASQSGACTSLSDVEHSKARSHESNAKKWTPMKTQTVSWQSGQHNIIQAIDGERKHVGDGLNGSRSHHD